MTTYVYVSPTNAGAMTRLSWAAAALSHLQSPAEITLRLPSTSDMAAITEHAHASGAGTGSLARPRRQPIGPLARARLVTCVGGSGRLATTDPRS